MNGAIIPHTPIAVDFWNVRETAANNCRLFFLSHAHADHIVGLTSSWKKHKIYCSELTKKILIHKLGVCHELVVGLPVDQAVVIAMDEFGKENLTVTLIDANHCPGAVIFLFQGYFGNILYTGDFRYYKSLSCHNSLQETVIDKLYLDNTYCQPKCVFPTRQEAADKIFEVIRKHLDFNVVFGMNMLGKEDLLAKIGLTFQTWIGVEPKKMEILKLLDLPDVFTCDVESTRIRVVLKNEISKRNLQVWNDVHPTIAILPTALFEGETNFYQNMENVFVIPFSDHSSFDELVSFVSEIKPKEIVPLVLRHKTAKGDPNNMRVNMTVFKTFLNKEPLSAITIPETVLQFMGARVKLGKARKRSRVLTAPKQKRQKCTGVVFSDEEGDTEESSSLQRCVEGELRVSESGEDSQAKNNQVRKTSGTLEQINKDDKLKSDDVLKSNESQDGNAMRNCFSNLKNNESENKNVENENFEFSPDCSDSKLTMNESLPLRYKEEKNESENRNAEIEMIESLPNCTNSELLTVNESLPLKSKENEFLTSRSSGDNSLAQELLEAFNQGKYKDQYTVGNPVYQRFVGHFCDYLKTITSDKKLNENKDKLGTQHTLNSSPKVNHDFKFENPNTSHKNDCLVSLSLDEVERDSDEASVSEFNWFSNKW